jgi:hypothetical protein
VAVVEMAVAAVKVEMAVVAVVEMAAVKVEMAVVTVVEMAAVKVVVTAMEVATAVLMQAPARVQAPALTLVPDQVPARVPARIPDTVPVTVKAMTGLARKMVRVTDLDKPVNRASANEKTGAFLKAPVLFWRGGCGGQ